MKDKLAVRSKVADIRAELDRTSGSLTLRFGVGGRRVSPLAVSRSWFVQDSEEARLTDVALEWAVPRALAAPGIHWTERPVGASLLFEYSLQLTDTAQFSVRVSNGGEEPLILRLCQRIAGLPIPARLFAPTGVDFYDLSRVSYLRSTAIAHFAITS